jgi:zinc protease
VYLAQSDALPIVDIQVDFDAGQRRDPAGKTSLAARMAGLMDNGIAARDPRRGGNRPGPYDGAMDENTLGEAWTDLGAFFSTGAGDDRLSASLRSLTNPALLDRAIALAARQLGEPAFPAEVWARERERDIAALRETRTRPGTVASLAWYPAVFGAHPYGRSPTEEDLRRIEVQDMREFHARHLQACRAKVSVVGAVSRAQADRLVTELLSRLPGDPSGRCDPLPPLPEVQPLQAPVEIRIPFNSAQAHVLIGQPGLRRNDPDHLPIVVGNYILGGGGFVSRLTHEVRDKRGLSYSVNSSFSPGLQVGGFWVGLQTRPDQAQQAVDVVRAELSRFVAEGPTDAELQAAKDNLIGGFALRLDSNRRILDNVASIAWNDLPLDELNTWTTRVQRITREDIRAAFARKLQPQRMVTVTVGAQAPAGAAGAAGGTAPAPTAVTPSAPRL